MDSLNYEIKNWVNLYSYSDSNGWKGYCELIKPFTISRANKVTSYFIDFFKQNIDKVKIVSNIFRLKEYLPNNSNIDNYLKYIEKYLIDFGYIKSISSDIYNNPNCLSSNFKTFTNIDADTIAMFSLLKMMDAGVDGHCFFVFEELGLIAYPHDDTGFGFIRINNEHINIEDIFLQKVSKLSDFTSILAIPTPLPRSR